MGAAVSTALMSRREPVPSPAPAAPAATRYVFVVDAADGADTLMRVLGVFAVQQAKVSALSFASKGGRATVRLEAEALERQRAEHVRLRIAQLPAVSNVAFGWRA